MNRRRFITWSATIAACPARARAADGDDPALADLEQRSGGRIGLFALDAASGRTLAHRADERFAMCSTFKWLLAAQLLAAVDRGRVGLGDEVRFGQADLLDYAPVARKHAARGAMTFGELGEAAVTVSDNTAANLLLRELGGPAALTAHARSLGDAVTRLDRIEPALNSNQRGDPRDTTTPRAMVGCMRAALAGESLSADSRGMLLQWMRTSSTGLDRLRAGLHASWNAGDKTGTGPNGAVNDVAIGFPPGRGPVLIAMYMSESRLSVPELSAVHAEAARLIVRALA